MGSSSTPRKCTTPGLLIIEKNENGSNVENNIPPDSQAAKDASKAFSVKIIPIVKNGKDCRKVKREKLLFY